MPEMDCRDEVFCERGHEVLGSVVQGTQMAYPDPFDVEELHLGARTAFNRTLDNVRNDAKSRILLVLGEAGSGKTHVIRALRAQTHRQRRGVIAYVHMTSELGDYRRYLLRQVVRSLSDPYLHDPNRAEQFSALDLISDALVNFSGLDADAPENLQEADDESLARLVSEYADVLSEIKNPQGKLRYADVDLNTLRTFLYRQSTRKSIQRRVNSFLNGEPLSPFDWQKLAALPADCDRGPMYLLGQISRITSAALGSPLIICIDQIEASDITGTNHEPFIHAMSTACELIENVPKLMVLLSCLDSAYGAHAPQLISSYRHRIENEPSPVVLIAARNADEIRQIVSRRLKGLFEGAGLYHVPPDSVYPMPETLPNELARQHLRAILQMAHRYWEECHRAQAIVEWKQQSPEAPVSAQPESVDRLRLAWNEFRTAGEHKVAESESAHLDLLIWILGEVPNELADRATIRFGSMPAEDGTVPPIAFILDRTGEAPLRRIVGLCEKDARGNGLYKQITALHALRQDGAQSVVVVRSTRFPSRGKLAEFIETSRASGDVYQSIDETCWETMQAMRDFLGSGTAAFSNEVVDEWRKGDIPLSGLPEVRAIIERRPSKTVHTTPPKTPAIASGKPSAALAPKAATAPAVAPRLSPKPSAPRTPAEPVTETPAKIATPPLPATESVPAASLATGAMVIGKSDGFTSADVTLDPDVLTRHTAIFGANGSGKTVLALNIIEMLLERGVAVILFDRKGDLSTYADEEAWTHATGAPDEDNRRRQLRDRLDIALYTPGSHAGRPLVLPFLPLGLDKLDEAERQDRAAQAAMILCYVCAPTAAKADMYGTVLSRAIELLCTADVPRTLSSLEHLLLTAPQELLSRLPAHNAKHCEEVGRRLHERRATHGRLFSEQGEKLDLHRMLLGATPGRVPLNIICTQFLDGDSALAWIAQFLAAAGNFIQEFPAADGKLQAVLMFDEADQYIPATSKPITKPGMENLLRRARAAGVGIMLASQNVGDFDYKALDNITTAFAGKLTTARALEKLRSRFGDSVEKLSRKTSGHFVMGVEGNVREIVSNMCLVKPATVPREQIERLAAAQTRR